MKTISLLVIILLVKGYTAAQGNVVIRERFKFKDTVEIDKYSPLNNGFSAIKLKMNPGEYNIQNLNDFRLLKGVAITGVDLVYSDFPVGTDFSELNRKRILELNMHLPEAFNSEIIEWRIVKQTGVAQTGGIQNYFHGIVVYYRPMPTFEEEHEEILSVIEGNEPLKDSSIIKVMQRNSHWKDMLVVCDVTGSMAPYTTQILFWINSNQAIKSFKQIIFFNDDEELSNNQIAELDSAGIWDIETSNTKKVIKTALSAMERGGHYENNLEAVCYAIKKYPENKSNVIMIADNWENPCDMKLLEFLKKEKIPIRIIVCGVVDAINPIYLDIAYATGGSVHTMEGDLREVAKIGEGKIIKFGKQRFRMSKGTFQPI
ncbi:MAG: VWA domain-containing protein [Crocinitomicaceae bacterium]|nr:VWA domain-containing protein [Crocinitomicaceae bacterium]MDP5011598.1 VWA domain-containing protein [Crocinitomicaceae bacterium]